MARWNRRGLESVYFLPSVASAALAPTVAEVTAGKRLDTVLRELNDFTFGGTTEDAADMASTFPKTVGGVDEVGSPNIVIYEGDVTTDQEEVVRAALPKGTSGFIFFVPPVNGARVTIAAGSKGRTWPIAVLSNVPNESGESGAATYTVMFSVPREPALSVTVLA